MLAIYLQIFASSLLSTHVVANVLFEKLKGRPMDHEDHARVYYQLKRLLTLSVRKNILKLL